MADLEQVRQAFGFLTREYGFVEAKAVQDAPPRGGCEVEYQAAAAVVAAVVDEWGIVWSPTIGRMVDRGRFRGATTMSFDRILEHASASQEDLDAFASLDAIVLEGAWHRVVVEPRSRLAMEVERASPEGGKARTAAWLEAYARLLVDHAEPMLRGDFSEWLALQEYNWSWLVAGELLRARRQGREPSLEDVERVLASTRDYLRELRSE